MSNGKVVDEWWWMSGGRVVDGWWMGDGEGGENPSSHVQSWLKILTGESLVLR